MTRARATTVAVVFWIVLGVVVWNVVFDRMLVLAGRRYSYAAALAADRREPYVRIDDWMGPAIRRGVWTASFAGGAVTIAGLIAVAVALRIDRSQR